MNFSRRRFLQATAAAAASVIPIGRLSLEVADHGGDWRQRPLGRSDPDAYGQHFTVEYESDGIYTFLSCLVYWRGQKVYDERFRLAADLAPLYLMPKDRLQLTWSVDNDVSVRAGDLAFTLRDNVGREHACLCIPWVSAAPGQADVR